MRTSKPISTISYNTPEYLKSKLDELVRNHTISDYMYIQHHAEADERKDHIHLWLKPNKLLDTMDLQDHFKELDLNNPTAKPLGCIDFETSKTDDWILYGMHLEPYLASKGQSREYHYTKDDFVYNDEDTFEDNYAHALKGSEWARRYQTLQLLQDSSFSPTDLIDSGLVPLNLATSLSAYKHMKRLDRAERHTHTPLIDEDGVIVEPPHGFRHADDVDFGEAPPTK